MNPWIQVTGWTLIHFVWQGGVLALATAAALRQCRRRSAAVRYAIACAGLTTMLAAPLMTAAFLRSGNFGPGPGPSGSTSRSGSDSAPAPLPPSTPGGPAFKEAITVNQQALDTPLSFVVWGWLAGVSLLFIRFTGGCWRVRRLQRAALAEPVSSWQTATEEIAARLRLTVGFRVVESTLTTTPVVLGWMRPVIMLPLAALASLTPGQIEAILAHELAHIRRRDYAVNLLQSVTETLLFYHPGVWWVSARVRQEREHCCDDVAVALCGEPAAYAEALAELASWRARPALALGAADGPLLRRVRRLLRLPEADEPGSAGGLAALALAILLAGGVAVQSAALATAPVAPVPVQALPQGVRVHNTDHFEIYHPADLDLHAERAGREAERAYEHVSMDLRHNLAFRVPVVLFHTDDALQQSVRAGGAGQPPVAPAADRAGDRILLSIHHPVDQWFGILTHEVTHIFSSDIIPGTAPSSWIVEGLAEYERGAWDPTDLAAVRAVIRSNAVPKLSGLGTDPGRDTRLVHILGHAAFDFIESRWGKPGVRQFMLRLRQAAGGGGDPYRAAFQMSRDEFDQAFERYLKERFVQTAGRSLADRFDFLDTVQIEGEITALHSAAPFGLACLEVIVGPNGGARRRWGLECGETRPAVMPALAPGDRVIVTGPPARRPATHRMVIGSLVRPIDGLTWRAPAG